MPAQVRCPTCRKNVAREGNPYRPFCSERCQLIDLGNWAMERYTVPGEPAEASESEDPSEAQARNGVPPGRTIH